MATFEYRQAEEIRDAFAKHGVRYLFIGKSGAILLGYDDVQQNVEVYVEKSSKTVSLWWRRFVNLNLCLMKPSKLMSKADEISCNLKMALSI